MRRPRGLNQPPGTAIASLALGLASIPLFIVAGLPAIICGHMALACIRSGRATTGKGLAMTGLVLGYLSIISTLVLVTGNGRKFLDMLKPAPAVRASGAIGSGALGKVSGARTPPATDPVSVEIPDTPVTGTLKGSPFRPEVVSLQSGMLTLRSGKGDRQVLILISSNLISAKLGEVAASKTYVKSYADPGWPHVLLRWPERATGWVELKQGFVLKLGLDNPVGRKVRGRIHLELPKEDNTRISGIFEADT